MKSNPKKKKKTCVELLLKAAEKFDVRVEIIDMEDNLFLFKKNGKEILVKDHAPNLSGYIASKVTKDKALIKRLLTKKGFRVPLGFKESNSRKALQLLSAGRIKFPLVVKPVDGSQGGAVSVGIKTEKWFLKAIEEVHKYNRRKTGKPDSFLIEEYVPGSDYRFLVLDGRVLTVMRREPAYVIGDGIHGIGYLIDLYNNQPGIGKHRPLCPISRDYELERNFQSRGISERTILPKGRKLYLRKNANVSTGGRSFECENEVHPEFKRIAVRVAKLLYLRFCAVDMIISNPKETSKYSIIEVNDTPGFDIHEFPYKGNPVPVAEHLIKAMFK